LDLGRLKYDNFALAAIPAVAYWCYTVVEVLFAMLKNGVELHYTFSVNLALVSEGNLNVSNKSNPNADLLLADDCILDFRVLASFL